MRKWWPLVAVCLGSFMLIVDTTVVTVALPDMARSLGAPLSDMQWVLNIYTLALGIVTLSAGSLGDLFGKRRIFVVSLIVFALASLACGLAGNTAVLIAARGVQGVGGAAMIGTTLALLGGCYEGKDRGTAIGYWSAVLGMAAAAGPILGGVLTQYLSWRAIFFINLPISVVTLLLAVLFVPESPRAERARVDVAGIVTFAVFAGALTYGLIRAGEHGWAQGATLLCFGIAAAGLVLFAVLEQAQQAPMLDIRLFGNASFCTVMLGVMASSVAFACLVYTSIWLQGVLRLSPLGAGVALIPMAVTSFLASSLIGKRLHTVSPRVTIGLGLLLNTVGCGLEYLMLHSSANAWTLAPGLVAIGLGIGIGGPGTNGAVLASVPTERSGMASGAMATFRQFGQALGVAALGVVFLSAMSHRLAGGTADPRTAAASVASGAAPDLPSVHDAGAYALGLVFLATAALSALACLCTVLWVRGAEAPAHAPESARATGQPAQT
ncbi:MFS transporter [Dactylosporangium roseum]|uniref:MFS transporter n=1 Tax=Dactylosporangium roseum TaxID=47989 RepID=A0ABY5Z2N7_9ACTN|nr:MFS transporter [Dactylosporangium roseum]UWZ34739.1 MFS transporter [Dactylosporangium roseum]